MPPASRSGGLPAEPAARPVPLFVARPAGPGKGAGRVGIWILIVLVVVLGTSTIVLTLKVTGGGGSRALVAVQSSPTTTTNPASPTPSESPTALVSSSPSPSPSPVASPSATPSGAAVAPPAQSDPSTTADLGSGVTIRIGAFHPGTDIFFDIYNRGSNPFVLDFETTDVTVYDDQTPPHVYTVTNAGSNHVTIQPSSSPYEGTSINVNGAPSASAKRWTVVFKAISGRQNVTLQYLLA